MLYTIALALVFALPAAAQKIPQTLDALEAAVVETLSDSAVKGAAIVIVENGAVTKEIYFGKRDVARGLPVDSDTIFRAGSVSKNLTSLLAVRLAYQGRLSLEAPISDIAPLIDVRNPWSGTDPVRMVHLLEHTAGLAGSSYAEYTLDQKDAPPSVYAEWLAPVKLRWRPGSFHSYANSGHTLAAFAMESVTGEGFDTLMELEVFTPLGMNSASFLTNGRDPDRLSLSYDEAGVPQDVWQMMIRPSGSLSLTARDLAKIVELYLARGASQQGELVSADLIERMERGETARLAQQGVRAGSYGLGNFGFLAGGHIFRGHWGRTEGFQTNMGYMPGTGRGFVLMLNTSDRDAASDLRETIAAYLTRDLAAPVVETMAPPPETDRFLGIYVNATHEMPLRQWMFRILEQREIKAAPEGLTVVAAGAFGTSTSLYQRAKQGGWVADGVPVATADFVELDGKTYWVDGQEAYVREPAFIADGRKWLFVSAMAASVIAIFHGLIWGVFKLVGKGPSGPGLRARAALALSGLGFIALIAGFVRLGLLGNSNDLNALGAVSPLSAGLSAASVLGFCAALAGVFFSVQHFRIAGLRSYAAFGLPAALILSAFGIFLLLNRWVPLMTWAH